MKIMVVTSNGKCKSFHFDGRYLERFIKEVTEVNGKIKDAWTYTHIKRNDEDNVGIYMGVKDVIKGYKLVI